LIDNTLIKKIDLTQLCFSDR